MSKMKLFLLFPIDLFSDFCLLQCFAETSPLNSWIPIKVGVVVKFNVLFEDDSYRERKKERKKTDILLMSILGIYILDKHSQLLVRIKKIWIFVAPCGRQYPENVMGNFSNIERMFWIISQNGARTYRDSEQTGLNRRVRFVIGLSGSD